MNKMNFLVTALFASTVSFSALADVERKFSEKYEFDKNGQVRLENINGSIDVVGWDREQIQFEYTIKADDEDDLERVEVDIDASSSRFSADVEFSKKKSGWFGGWNNYSSGTVDLRIKVPHSAVLKMIESVNGEITIEDVHGSIKTETVNGEITVKDAKSDVTANTVNGEVNIIMKSFNEQRVKAESVNGDIVVYLPENDGFTVVAETLNGDLSNDFGIKVVEGTYVGADMDGRYKSGGGKLSFDTVNGDVSVKKD